MTEHNAVVFRDDDFLKVWGQDAGAWGWQCFTCRAEETGLETLDDAEEARDQHVAEAS